MCIHAQQGYVVGLLGRLPVAGDKATGAGAHFTVLEMDGRRIKSLSVELTPTA